MEEPPQTKSRNKGFTEFENNTIQKCESPMDAIPRWNYDVLRIIFQYLSAKDLQNAAKVCRSWLEAAHMEKQTRKHLQYIFHIFSRGSEEKLDSVWIEPSIGLHFITADRLHSYHLKNKTLSRNYNCIIFEVDGIVLENNIRNEDGTKTVSRYSYCRDVSYILSAHLPQLPNVHISTFFVTNNKTMKQAHEVISVKEAFKKFVGNLMTDNASKENLMRIFYVLCCSSVIIALLYMHLG